MQVTTDIWFAAFLKSKGINPADFQNISKHKGKYKYSLSDEEWRQHKLEFVKSDASKFKQHFQELKDLLY